MMQNDIEQKIKEQTELLLSSTSKEDTALIQQKITALLEIKTSLEAPKISPHDMLTIKELATFFKISENSARWIAKSKHLRNIKGAVENVNRNGAKGKYEMLRIQRGAALKVLQAHPGVYR